MVNKGRIRSICPAYKRRRRQEVELKLVVENERCWTGILVSVVVVQLCKEEIINHLLHPNSKQHDPQSQQQKSTIWCWMHKRSLRSALATDKNRIEQQQLRWIELRFQLNQEVVVVEVWMVQYVNVESMSKKLICNLELL